MNPYAGITRFHRYYLAVTQTGLAYGWVRDAREANQRWPNATRITDATVMSDEEFERAVEEHS